MAVPSPDINIFQDLWSSRTLKIDKIIKKSMISIILTLPEILTISTDFS